MDMKSFQYNIKCICGVGYLTMFLSKNKSTNTYIVRKNTLQLYKNHFIIHSNSTHLSALLLTY